MSELPAGLTTRPSIPDDLDAVVELVGAEESMLHDVVDIDREDIAGDWARPSFELARDTLSVWEGETLVGHAEIFRGRRAEVTVRPGEEGRGIGTFLRAWTEWRALEAAPPGRRVVVGQSFSDHHRVAAAALEADGYATMWTSWILRIDLHDEIPEPELPEGFAIRTFEPGSDDREVYQVIEDAFNEWPDRDPSSFEDWAALTIRRNDFDPTLTFLVVDGSEIAGVAFTLHFPGEGWVQQFAVKKSHRRRGLARAMLQTAFAEFRRRGERLAGVSTDSRTGALSLYEHVGMHVERSYTHWAKELRAGSDRSTIRRPASPAHSS